MQILEQKNTITKMKCSVDGLNSRMGEGREERICKLEDRKKWRISQFEQLRKKRVKKKLTEARDF